VGVDIPFEEVEYEEVVLLIVDAA